MKKMTIDSLEELEMSERQLHVFYKEISSLSKKSSNDGVNKFKLSLINGCLEKVNAIIGSPLEGFEMFEESLVPSNSDVAMILGQYVAAMYAFRLENTKHSSLDQTWFWMVNEKRLLKTRDPHFFKYLEK